MRRAQQLIERARSAVALATLYTGDYREAERLLAEARRLAESDGNLRAGVLDQFGVLAHFRTVELPRARWPSIDEAPERGYFEQALAIRRRLGTPAEIAESLLHLGWTHQVIGGDWGTSIPLFREALQLVEPDGDGHVRAEVHRHIGFHVLVHEQRPEAALPYFRTSAERWRAAGEPGWLVYGLAAQALCEAMVGEHPDALDHGQAAVELARTAGLRQHVVTYAEATLHRIQELLR